MGRPSDASRRDRRPHQALFDLAMMPADRSPEALLDAVRRNVERAAEGLGQLTGVGFRCGCQLTLEGGQGGTTPWRVLAWDDSRCTWTAHRPLKAKWEASNL